MSNFITEAVIVVDPLSTGRVVAEKVMQRGFNVVCLWTAASQRVEGIGECNLEFLAVVHEIEGDFGATFNLVSQLPYKFIACMVGCECGVEINDYLSEKLGLASNGTEFDYARRDKWAMQERVRECGLRAIKQTAASSMEEVEQFITNERMSKWVIKPRRDAGSHGVFLCETLEEARVAFTKITGQITIFGESNDTVLVQEFLAGKEYVVDTVSCQGEHRAVAIWEYDRIHMHGSAFVYLDDHLYKSETGEKEEVMVNYIFQVIDALGVKFGACHAEVMWLESENRPCLVEVGTRPHGAGGNFPQVCDPVIGYNQVDVTIDAYLAPEKFHPLPKRPADLHGMGIQYKIICYKDGVLEGLDLSQLVQLQSYKYLDMHRSIGDKVTKTIDLVSSPGIILLCHPDADVVAREKVQLRAFEESMLQIREDTIEKTTVRKDDQTDSSAVEQSVIAC
jgi:biotin carboxylase